MKDLIVKSFNINIKSVDKEKRVVTFTGTKEITDRDGDIIRVAGMNLTPYRKNPIVLWAHNKYDLPVGQTKKIKKINDNQLDFDVEFAPLETYGFADTVYKLVIGGYIRATSVSFLADRDSVEQNPKSEYGRIFNKTELAELSIVTVPANPVALVQSKDIQKALADKVIDDNEIKVMEELLKTLPVTEEKKSEIKDAELTVINTEKETEKETHDVEVKPEQNDEEATDKSDPYGWIWTYDMEPKKDPDADLYKKLYDMMDLNNSE